MMSDRLAAAERDALSLLSDIAGSYVWSVRLSADDVLRMDFGDPHLKVREPARALSARTQQVVDSLERRMVVPTGKWHLFVEDGNWSIRTRNYEGSREQARSSVTDEAIRQLDGQKLVRTEYLDGVWRLHFDLQGLLSILPSTSGGPGWIDEGQWFLFFQHGGSATFTNGRKLVRS